MHFVVECAGDAAVVNRIFRPFLALASRQNTNFVVSLLATTRNRKAVQAVLAAGWPGIGEATVQTEELSEAADVLFPHPDGDPQVVLEALTRGVKVLPDWVELDIEEDYRDFREGYFSNPDAQWYARLFPEPRHVNEPAGVLLGLGVTINPRAIILNTSSDGAGGRLIVGRASHLGADALLNLGHTSFTIGRFCIISANFSAHAMRHSMSHVSNFAITKGPFKFFGKVYDETAPIRVGHDVWIGEGVTCLPGVTFGDGCVVGAGSVVTKSLAPYGIYAGNPARLFRYRFEKEKIKYLREIEWWNFPFDRLKDIRDSFTCDVTALTVDELRELL